MFAACLVLGAIFLIVFLHPYLTYPMSLSAFSVRPINMDPQARLPSMSFVFSAYNEQLALPAKIANMREIKALYPDAQILAYSDCSSDDTLEILERSGDLLEVIAGTERVGKATGMRRMVARATGDIVIFTDANVLVEPGSLAALRRYFTDPAVGGVAGTLKYINEDASSTARAGGLYWRLEEAIKRRESRTGSIMGADGAIFATRRELYPEVPAHLLDDMVTSMSVTFHGLRLVHATDVIAYEKNATSSRDEFRRKRRIACRAFNTHRYLWPQLVKTYAAGDIYKYISHKLVRWLGLPLITICVVLLAASLVLATKVMLAVVIVVLAAACLALGVIDMSPFGTVYQVFLSIVATFYGVLDSLHGKTYQTWAPAASRN